MVKYIRADGVDEEVGVVFHCLADPTRRRILERVAKDNLTVGEIAKPYKISLPAVSKHLKVLERAGLVVRHKEGREYSFELKAEPMRRAVDYLGYYKRFWNAQLHDLEDYLVRQKERDGK